jgi:hypothetical protein
MTSCQRQLVASNGALQHYIASEAEQLGRAARTYGRHLAGFLNQRLLLDQAPEVLLVQAAPANASTVCCNCSSENSSGISSNTTGRI